MLIVIYARTGKQDMFKIFPSNLQRKDSQLFVYHSEARSMLSLNARRLILARFFRLMNYFFYQ